MPGTLGLLILGRPRHGRQSADDMRSDTPTEACMVLQTLHLIGLIHENGAPKANYSIDLYIVGIPDWLKYSRTHC